MRLEYWAVRRTTSGDQCLIGNVYDHPNFPKGHEIRTSNLQGRRGELVITASGSAYELGMVDPLYEARTPNPKRKLLDSLMEVPAWEQPQIKPVME